MTRYRLIGDYPALPDTHPDRRPLWKEVLAWLGFLFVCGAVVVSSVTW